MKTLAAMIIIGLLTISSPVLAHTGIKSTSPANEQVLETAPEQLALTFRAPVRLMKVTLKDAEASDQEIDFKPSATAGKSFDIDLPEIADGEYLVNWICLGKDGHKMKGDFSFSVRSEEANNDDSQDETQKNKRTKVHTANH